jgi:amidase
MVPFAHGNDLGGSLRYPASACGLFGLKPTRARNPLGPEYGDVAAGGAVEHTLTRSVRDSAALLDATSGPDLGDPYWAPPPARPFGAEVGADPGQLRIGVLDRPGGEGYLDDPECRAAVAGAALLLEALGHHLEASAPAAMFEPEFLRHFSTVIAADTEATFQNFEELLGRPIDEDELEGRNVAYRRIGRKLSAVDYLDSRAWFGTWARGMADWWEDHDLLVTPTVGAPPPELGWFTAAGPEHEGERVVSFIPYTAQFNMTGQPAITLPLHWTPGGLPVGVQFVAAYGREDLLIRVASQLEQAAPWAGRHPQVHA